MSAPIWTLEVSVNNWASHVVRDAEGKYVAEVIQHYADEGATEEERRASISVGTLISAAPELMEALQGASAFFLEAHRLGLAGEEYTALWYQIQAALAKAQKAVAHA